MGCLQDEKVTVFMGELSKNYGLWILDYTVHVFPVSTLESYTAIGLNSMWHKHICFGVI